ncbi:pyruvate dehydrogenase E2 component (dihydrolipoamide acetyltransferase) [Oceanotoga teriensis]|jgi:pyruvate dehydrogenase E2 component (dihydrolipoamide acetyltransferase)|uniref:Dihydrolipoamide acetyltransferase component of pyruvate dehydrogenase complex n=1 Tax=Oceanotoga teriensis TaxID=515440 RepID=A0AA45C6L5_9BACT|nr:dihydrolipoamide acetyltransferase family protein [Oceanotoga teriensis]PWJ92159.1 pyruvate dehydrogenase E2 component (dihydrolipoamide acetyltransferase) [Oceanotoga teriensis]
MAEKIFMIALSPTMKKGKITKWRVNQGDTIKEGQIICDVETDKTTMEYESMNEGTILKIIVNSGERASVGQTIAIVGEENENIQEILDELKDEIKENNKSEKTKTEKIIEEKDTNNINTKQNNEDGSHIKISPLAKKIAKLNNIDIKKIKGSGPNGRIIKKDIEEFKDKKTSFFKNDGEDKIIEISDKRRIIAERLSESKFTSPHYYLKVSVNMENILNTRKEMNKKGEKVSLNSYLIKIASQAILKHKIINSSWNDENIIEYSNIDIGIAVAQKDGLITPIIRQTQFKGIKDIDTELKQLIEKAKDGSLEPEEYTNSTFTISNLGSFGIEEFTAIINPPGSAILAIGSINEKPIVENGEIKIKPIMKMTLSCDHRLIDGASGAEFLKYLKDIIENPFKMLY